MAVDLVLLHAPSVYDFRQKTILYGPVSDLIPPSPVFEMYPIGLPASPNTWSVPATGCVLSTSLCG